ncbi:MAG: SAM-dependent methyltransferase [Clostridia bacterium]|nr:SAM-dependent methyltransferase [Clostridia bacterium]
MLKLSERLLTISEFINEKAMVCDIGTDHGFLAIHLIESGKTDKVIAADIAKKPLENARKNIEKSGISGIELRLSNGFSAINPGEIDTAVIAGMGGEVIAEIIKCGKKVAARKDFNLILQPTTSPEALRKFLYQNGYEIISEKAVFENSKLYSVMKVCFKGVSNPQTEGFYFIGKVNPKTESGYKYIKKQLERNRKCMESLENIPKKQKEFLYYKKVFTEIEEVLNGV